MFNFDPKIFNNKARIISFEFLTTTFNHLLVETKQESILGVLRNGQGGSLTLLDKSNRYYRDAIGGRALSKFPKRIPRFGLQSYNNELARN